MKKAEQEKTRQKLLLLWVATFAVGALAISFSIWPLYIVALAGAVYSIYFLHKTADGKKSLRELIVELLFLTPS